MARRRARQRAIFIDGYDELIRTFEVMPEEAEKILSEATREAAEIVLTAARQTAPVATGKLRDSLNLKEMKIRKSGSKGWRLATKGVRYAFAVEAGTKKMPARPFMRDAFDNNEQRVKDKINEIVTNKIEEVWRRD
jgi:HK97 gp10 family phage protein